LKYDPAIGSFKGWLLQITRWRIADQFRKTRTRQCENVPLSPMAARRQQSSVSPIRVALIWMRSGKQSGKENLFEAAITRVKKANRAEAISDF